MTSMQIFIIIILTNNFYLIIMRVILSPKNKLNTINIFFLQNNRFGKKSIIRLFAL